MRLTKEQIKGIKILSKKRKMSERAIAKHIGCSRSAVWYHLNKNKLI